MTTSQDRFLKVDLDALIAQLTIEEKAGLLAGKDHWRTFPIPRLDVPSIKVTDGPNGARGGSQLKKTPALCIPCGTACAATFDTALIQQVGQVLAEETKARASVVLLGPTVNIQRSPLGGRAFESFSEDPTLSGEIAAAYINGLQSRGVAATLKHYVCNDMEHERNAVDSLVSDRALREVYLRPFQLAIKKSNPWAIMTSYNSVNGVHVSESHHLLQDVLRKEWGYDGLTMSDWWGTYSSSEALNAGLDLEMPGPTRWRTPLLLGHDILARKVKVSTVDARVKSVLKFVQRAAKELPEIVYGKDEERTLDNKDHRAIARQVATESIVLLKNTKNVLPLAKGLKRIAVFGSSAKAPIFTGGGSAEVGASYFISPFEGICEAAPQGCQIDYAVGATGHKGLPLLGKSCKTTSHNPTFGTTFDFYRADVEGNRIGDVVSSIDLFDSLAEVMDGLPCGLSHPWAGVMSGTFEPDGIEGTTDEYEFGLQVAGRAKLYLDDELVVENWSHQTPGNAFYNTGTIEVRKKFTLEKGRKYALRVDFSSIFGYEAPVPVGWGLRVGAFPVIDADEEIKKAAQLAASVDVSIIVVGLSPEWESEGYDRPNLDLPLRLNDLVSAVADSNPNTVVVVQSGSAVLMPWIENVSTVLWAPYAGNETGSALGNILFGHQAPSGRLSITFPRREEDVPAFLDFRSEMGKVLYSEGIYVGYKYYAARKIDPLFAFGHGLNYTIFEYTNFKIDAEATKDGFKATARATIKNKGDIASSHSVLLFLAPPKQTHPAALSHPPFSLAAFARTSVLKPGKSQEVALQLDKYAVSHFDDSLDDPAWVIQPGQWSAWLGDFRFKQAETTFKIAESFVWTGL